MQKNIHIDNIERTFAKTGNEKFVLISGKDKYQFWGTEQGVRSGVSIQFDDLGVKPNMDVEIEYLEEPESFVNAKGETINWTKRSIRGIFEASGTPTPPEPKTRPTSQNTAPQSDFKPRNFDQEAYEKCSSLWSASLLQRTGTTTKDAIAMVETGMCWELFQAIKADGKKRFFEFSLNEDAKNISSTELTGQEKAKILGDELPTIQVQEDTTEWDKTFNCEVCNAPGRTHGDGHECLDF